MQTRIYFRIGEARDSQAISSVAVDYDSRAFLPDSVRNRAHIWTESQIPALPPQPREPTKEPDWHKYYSR